MNSKKEQTNSGITNLGNEASTEKKIDPNNINKQTSDTKFDKQSIDIDDEYKFGWSSYSEITNGRFAMMGFLAIILIELFSQQSFLKWAGIL
ncbi:chlorophyll a/b-binding protein [uncultured Prochlorococcus sp.]|uniref:chlorophyll a/b-binding protein n=1 Tax=uncultured Prochlorococcus sp. TaxID=159733 RepID=UPI002588ED8D|nr:chlorophyll a/b-binding protein [uncultured Prochlorococcus sp.]